MANSMIRKSLFAVSIAGLLVLGAAYSARGQYNSGQAQSEKQQPATKSVAGKVATIGNGGTSFTLEPTGGAEKNALNFVVDKNTQVKGQVKQGTMVTVEYQPMEDGQLLAVSITAQA
jgi:Domain of unknown function (DUF5666)